MAARATPALPPVIARLKLTDILAQAKKENRWSARQAREADLWYRRFLFLTLKNRRRAPHLISQKSDHLWHEHILFTKRYRADCERIFGRYLDHTPVLPRRTLRERALENAARALYLKYFGVLPLDIGPWCF